MNIVFLDFDGVLNNMTSCFINLHTKNDGRFVSIAAPDPICVQCVEWLLIRCDAYVVVSSSWRQGLTVDGLKDVLEFDFGSKIISDRVLDKTKNTDLREVRGHQIKYWLDYTAREKGILVDKYVILDDDSDMLKTQMSKFVKTDTTRGFCLDNIKKATGILGLDFSELLSQAHPV